MANVSVSSFEDIISSLSPQHKKYIDERYNKDERFRELYDALKGKKVRKTNMAHTFLSLFTSVFIGVCNIDDIC